jgi:hypothetical protein
LTIVSIADAQSMSEFAAGEGKRVYDMLDGFNCFDNANCTLSDFTPTTACDYKPASLKCNDAGQLAYL